MLTFLHIGFAFLWLGCVLTEALFERAMLAGDRASHKALANLHARVDLVVEIPAMLVVLVTGALLWMRAGDYGVAELVMIGAGAVALLANGYCVWLVFKRRSAAHAEEWDAFDRLDHLQHRVGAIVLLGLLVAIVAGALIR